VGPISDLRLNLWLELWLSLDWRGPRLDQCFNLWLDQSLGSTG